MPVSLEEYFRTTFEDKLLVKLPEREDEHLTPATRLLEKRREMTEVEQVRLTEHFCGFLKLCRLQCANVISGSIWIIIEDGRGKYEFRTKSDLNNSVLDGNNYNIIKKHCSQLAWFIECILNHIMIRFLFSHETQYLRIIA